jgi:hypothetical protein
VRGGAGAARPWRGRPRAGHAHADELAWSLEQPGRDEVQASQAVVLPYVSAAEHLAPAPQGRAAEPPRGKEAARQVLESDPSRFWTVREVHDEEVRRGWTEPRTRGAKGNPPSRIALDRLQKDYPQNVEVTDTPVLAYRWSPNPSQSRSVDDVATDRDALDDT